MAGNNTTGSGYVQLSKGGQLHFTTGQESRGNIGAQAGGGVSANSLFSQGVYIGTEVTSNPERVTTSATFDFDTINALREIDPTCPFNFYAVMGCPPESFDNFRSVRIYVDAVLTGRSTSAPLLEGTQGNPADPMEQVDISAAVVEYIRQQIHAPLAPSTIGNAGVNHGVALGRGACVNGCSRTTKEFLVVTDAIAPATIPRIAYTADGGTTWTAQTIAACTNGTAEAVAVAGTTVVVACSGTTGGIYYAPLAAVKAGTATFTLASGVTSGHAFNDIATVSRQKLIAVGANGRIAVSRDGGATFTYLNSPVATALNAVAVGSNSGLAWVVGASGVVIRVLNLQTAASVTVAGVSTDALNTVAVPYYRPDEVYIGSAAGEIHRSLNASAATPTWEELFFSKPTGGGVIEDIAFTGAMGCVMLVVQTDASADSSILYDFSGGGMGNFSVVRIGTFSDPSNNGYNCVIPTSVNYALVVGEVVSSLGYVGRMSAVIGITD